MWQKALSLALLAMIIIVCLPAAAKDETTRLTVRVVREADQHPVGDAHVVVRFKTERLLKDKRVSWEAKTNGKGILILSDVSRGPVRIQVIAKGYQTHGSEHELSQPEQEITVLLKPPQKQFSAY